MQSVFLENDWKRHMSVNLETGLWQDFKSGEKGNFISLYAYVENLTYQQAQVRLLIRNFDSIKFDESLNLSSTKEVKNEDLGTIIEISADMKFSSTEEEKAWNYVTSRCLFDLENSKKYFISNNPRFAGRIIIPFEQNGFMYYFQARTLTDQKPKYLNPTYYNNLRVSDVLYPYDEDAEYLVLCEGPIDAISLQIQGVNATSTQGCHVSKVQADALMEFKGRIIVGFDNDKAGMGGRDALEVSRKQRCKQNLWYCQPPDGHKDWNSAHTKFINLDQWIKDNMKKIDEYFYIQEMMKYMG